MRSSLKQIISSLTFSLLLIALIFLKGCSPTQQWTLSEIRELDSLSQARNFFDLNKRLNDEGKSGSPHISYYHAVVARAFNKPQESNRHLNEMMTYANLPDSLVKSALSMKMYNYLRLHRYPEAIEVTDSLVSQFNLSKDKRKEVHNTRLILKALKSTPPQMLTKYGDSKITLNGSHIDVSINGLERDYAYDTGANFSFLMASEAEELGINIRKVGFNVSTNGALSLEGDVGIADSMRIGKMDLRNVVFLIFPDEALTFPGMQIKGMIGFPVLEAMGELRFQKGSILVPEKVPPRVNQNLVLDGLTPLIRFQYENSYLLGRLDTGAGKTVFYKPFFEKFLSGEIDSTQIDTVKIGSVGGIASYPVYQLEKPVINLSGKPITLDNVSVHLSDMRSTRDHYLYANIGLDLIAQFDGYIINFRDLVFTPLK